MHEQEPGRRDPFEQPDFLHFAQQELEHRGYYFFPVEKEQTEALVTEPLAARVRTLIQTRHFANLAGHVLLTFSGYEDDPREIYGVPEIRAYFGKLDAELPELPALLAFLPAIGFNGPGIYLMLLGDIDARIDRRDLGVFDVHLKGAERIVQNALHRIEQAGMQYGLRQEHSRQLAATFLAGSRYRYSAG